MKKRMTLIMSALLLLVFSAGAAAQEENGDVPEFEKERIVYGTEEYQWFEIYTPSGKKGKTPVLLWAHANSGPKNVASAAKIPMHLVHSMISEGYAVVSWESVPQISTPEDVENCSRDLETIMEWIAEEGRRHGIDKKNVFLSGASRGSIISWDFTNHHADKIRGAYFVQALPSLCWDERIPISPLDFVNEDSPALVLAYIDGMNTKDGHHPKYGKMIQERYEELGIGDRVLFLHSLGKNGLYSQLTAFMQKHIR